MAVGQAVGYRVVREDDHNHLLGSSESFDEEHEDSDATPASQARPARRTRFRKWMATPLVIALGSVAIYVFLMLTPSGLREPVDCVGEWSDWSACTMTCGAGMTLRRYSEKVREAFNGKPCRYSEGALKTDKCNMGPCPGTQGFMASPPLCAANVSIPVGNWTVPRKFNEPEWMRYCHASYMQPWDEFVWPGRNWCWARTKAKGCYAVKGGLPPWHWAQIWARSSDGRVPTPEEYAFPGLLNPELCDRIDHGAAVEGVTDQELRDAQSWIHENLAIYVLNLKWSTQRWEAMKARLAALGLSGDRIEGIDMRTPGALERARKDGIVPTEEEFSIDKAWKVGRELMHNTNPGFGQALLEDWIGIGTIGCAAAHVHAQAEAHLRATKAGKPMALIMEDDIWLQDDFVVKLFRLITTEAPCDWDVIALSSRCPYGTCVSAHLSRVQVDGNEPPENCHGEVQYGMFAMLYRTVQLPDVNHKLKKRIWNDRRPGCVPPDVAMSAISTEIAYYAVPGTQAPGFAVEAKSTSNRLGMNR